MENHGCERSVIWWMSKGKFAVNILKLYKPSQGKIKEG